MAVGIAIRDDVGIIHWAPFSTRRDRTIETGRAITRELRKTGKPKLILSCERQTSRINQIKRISTRVASVTCIACIVAM